MPRRPRLLLLITLAEIGGAQTYVAQLLPALAESFDVTLAAHGPGPLVAAAEAAGVEYVPLRNVRRELHPWRDLLGLVELVRLCLRVRPHVVHANSSKAGILGRVAAWLCRVPVRVFTAHGWAFAAGGRGARRFYLWADRLMVPLTSTVICVAENERELGLRARTCRPGRCVVIRNAIDVAAAPRARPDEGTPRLVWVGRLRTPKDPLTFARALRELDGGSFLATLVGDGPGRTELEPYGDVLELLGDRDDVPQLLADASVFVLTSLSEGMPMSVIEAMAAGLPVVASDVGGLRELVVPEETGLLVPAADADALAAALRRLVADPGLRRRLGDAGRERAERLFDVGPFRAAHVELYRSLLAPP